MSSNAKFLRGAVTAAVVVTIGILVFIVGYIFLSGVPNLSWGLFASEYTSQNASLMPALVNTLIITLLALIISVPMGVGAAIYLCEYTTRGNKLVKTVRITAETLAGIPSIVYGLFGYLMFVVALKWGYSLLSGTLTLAIMILPIIMRTAEEAIKSVPDTYREGSFGLGAGRLRTVMKIVLPAAAPGILSGVILSIGRIVGETAALIYTAGTVAGIPSSIMRSGRTLSVHMYSLWNEGLHIEKSYATAVVLIVLVAVINALSAFVSGKVGKNVKN